MGLPQQTTICDQASYVALVTDTELRNEQFVTDARRFALSLNLTADQARAIIDHFLCDMPIPVLNAESHEVLFDLDDFYTPEGMNFLNHLFQVELEDGAVARVGHRAMFRIVATALRGLYPVDAKNWGQR